MELNDELLCAYLDGELDDTMGARVAAALETDAGGRVRLERMRTADVRLRREVPATSRIGADPIAEFIRRHDAGNGAPARRRWTVPAAIAAGLIGLGFVYLFTIGRAPRAMLAEGDYAQGTLRESLETRASGERVEQPGGTITVLLTLRTNDGRSCRLFDSIEPAGAAEGVACREERGWRIVAWDGTVSKGGGFHTAGASPLLDLVMDRLEARTLDPAEERAAIARRWQPGK